MKGLDLAERYYREYGSRMIQEKFPGYQDRIAAGLVGEGSECYGFDDHISRDHDWGPGFCLWLSQEDYQAIGQALQLEYNILPQSMDGFKRITSQWGGGRVGVFEIGAYYRKFIGLPHAPKSPDQWLYIPEETLATCTNGKVFTDPSGRFSQIRKELLDFYPEDVRLFKISARCVSSAQAGQYSYRRSIQHKELFAAQYAETKFCADILSLTFLLNKRYAPFYKWSHRAVRELPLLGGYFYQKVAELADVSLSKKKQELIDEISSKVIETLREEGLSDSGSDFLFDHGLAVKEKIKDDKLRKRIAWKWP